MDKKTEQKIDDIHERVIRWDERLFGKFGLEARQGLVEIVLLLVVLFLAAKFGNDFISLLR